MNSAPWGLVELAIEPTARVDQKQFLAALGDLTIEDVSLHLSFDPESGQTILSGPSEEHLDSALNALKQAYGTAFNIGVPQVAYRETLTTKAEIDYTHKKLAGGNSQFAKVTIMFEPAEAGTGSSFESKTGAVPEQFIQGIEKGINSVMSSGLLSGSPIVDVKATLIDGVFHYADSSVVSFEIAARLAFRQALYKNSILLEPIMKIEVTAPEEYIGSIVGDLNSRRGQVLGQEMLGSAAVINAMVPLTNMFGYVNQLRSFSQGRATYSMQFSHYAPVSPPRGGGSFPPAIGMRA